MFFAHLAGFQSNSMIQCKAYLDNYQAFCLDKYLGRFAACPALEAAVTRGVNGWDRGETVGGHSGMPAMRSAQVFLRGISSRNNSQRSLLQLSGN
jgi:hypothetical protein